MCYADILLVKRGWGIIAREFAGSHKYAPPQGFCQCHGYKRGKGRNDAILQYIIMMYAYLSSAFSSANCGGARSNF